jgi:hypothetical protein
MWAHTFEWWLLLRWLLLWHTWTSLYRKSLYVSLKRVQRIDFVIHCHVIPLIKQHHQHQWIISISAEAAEEEGREPVRGKGGKVVRKGKQGRNLNAVLSRIRHSPKPKQLAASVIRARGLFKQVWMNISICVYAYLCMNIHVCIYIYINICIYIYLYIYTYISNILTPQPAP